MTDETYDFPVTGYRVVDGDTYYLTVTIREGRSAFRVTCGPDTAEQEIRLNGWDTPEKRSTPTRVVMPYEREAAKLAHRLAEAWFATQPFIRVETDPDPEKYGRWLGVVYSPNGAIGDYLAANELAVPYDGTKATRRWYQVHTS